MKKETWNTKENRDKLREFLQEPKTLKQIKAHLGISLRKTRALIEYIRINVQMLDADLNLLWICSGNYGNVIALKNSQTAKTWFNRHNKYLKTMQEVEEAFLK